MGVEIAGQMGALPKDVKDANGERRSINACASAALARTVALVPRHASLSTKLTGARVFAEIAAFVAGIQAQFAGTVDRSVVNAENGQALAELLAARREARDGPAREQAAAETAKVNAKLVVGTEMKEGVKKMPSGLLIETLVEGTGDSPVTGSSVKVHYTGKLANGSVFDSSVERGEPATFAVAQVVKGFAEGILNMKVASPLSYSACMHFSASLGLLDAIHARGGIEFRVGVGRASVLCVLLGACMGCEVAGCASETEGWGGVRGVRKKGGRGGGSISCACCLTNIPMRRWVAR